MQRLTLPRPAIPALAAFALLAAAAPASAASFTASTTDPAGDSTSGAGSDIRAVDAAYDQTGTATVSWTLDSTTAGLFREVVTFGTRQGDGSCAGANRLFVFADSNGSYAGWRQVANGADIDGPNSPGRTAGISVTQDGTKLTASLNDPAAAGYTYDCAQAESADSPADQVIFDGVPAFGAATTTTAPTLATLPGSLLSPAKCQKLGGSGFVRTRNVSGVGKVRLQMRSNATSKPGTPLRLTIAGGSPDDVSWKLDGKAVRGTVRSLTLKPSKLFQRTDHVITVTFVGRNGRRSSYPLAFKTLGCSSAMTASVAKRKGGSILRLRIDSTEALTSAAFPLPSSTQGKIKSTFKVRLRSATDDKTRTWIYRFVKGKVVTPAGAPKFVTGKKGPAFTGLPAQTGILRVDVGLLRAPLRKTALRATAVIGGATKTLKTKTD